MWKQSLPFHCVEGAHGVLRIGEDRLDARFQKKPPRRKFLHLAAAQAVAAGDVVYRKAANQPPDRFMVGCATDNNQFHMYGEIK
jgi:hypothetical protein